ncbi:hypothetical protein Grass_212 [Bacillus phage Grass]|uniref:Uncharacterized protein n=1 Tax=Bacillus phage Grass TaxID=1406785 RepID=U5PY26_BPGRA|nr:hypothetical protein Grass_212 [Bacillus phage Grass]AGY47477.1 hypothetical protein Grass_212 [Bacillus phage Grass]
MSELSKSAIMAIKSLRAAGIRISRLSPESRLFLYGVKPALAIPIDSAASKIFVYNFPSLVEPLNSSPRAVIFQDAYKLHEYVQKAEVVEVNNMFWEGSQFKASCKDVGIALGYPPSACAWFAQYKNRADKNEEGTRQVYYHGMQFMTHENLIVENINWLRENMPVPEHLQDKEYVSFPRRHIANRIKMIGTFDDILSSSLGGEES